MRSSIDDFGTGYSSLSYLKQFPISDLKIDKSFVDGIEQDDSIAKAVMGLAESMELNVVAEGVETAGQNQRLVDLGCRTVQGYYFSRPQDAARIGKIPTFCGWPGQR